MNRIARIVFRPVLPVLLLFLSLVGTTSFAQEPPHQPGKMTIWQARREVAWGRSVRYTLDGFDYDVVNSKKVKETVHVNLAMAPAVEAYSNSCMLDMARMGSSLSTFQTCDRNAGARVAVPRFERTTKLTSWRKNGISPGRPADIR